MKYAIFEETRIGKRSYNQDRVGQWRTPEALFLAVADGMGGHLHGEIAAQIAVDCLGAAFRGEAKPRIEDPEGFLAKGIARGLGVERVLELNRPAIGDLLPDRTFLLLVDAELAGERSGDEPDRIEREGVDFRGRVEAAYEELARTFGDRIVAVDGTLPREEIAAHVAESVRQLS